MTQWIALMAALALASTSLADDRAPSVSAYQSIQQAIDANPGKVLWVPPGDYHISEKIRIRKDATGLWGPGRIIQTNPKAPILEIERASGVSIRDLRLTRPQGYQETDAEGVLAIDCRELSISDVQVLENRSRSAAIALRGCVGVQVRSCLVRNYMRLTIDDRTASADWGYAFNCIDGSGIGVRDSRGVLIQNNRIIEHDLMPTPEVKQKYDLGRIIKRNATKGEIISQKAWDSPETSNWHQGSAIVLATPETNDCAQLLGNYIENAAQGIDVHADHVIIAQNIIINAHAGMKAMHGSRHVLIIGNQFIRNTLWAIALMPGAASHAASVGADGKLKPANIDGGSIIANNIISDFGYGHANWIWGNNNSPIKFDEGQKPSNPPLADVLVHGNVIYNTGRDGVIVDGKAQPEPPRYRFAVRVSAQAKGIRFANNIFHPGTEGVSNVELKP